MSIKSSIKHVFPDFFHPVEAFDDAAKSHFGATNSINSNIY